MSERPDDPLATARRMWEDDAASRALGLHLVELAAGHAVVAMTVTDQVLNGYRMAHGGLIATLADTAFALACNSHGRMAVASGFDISFLEAGRPGDRLVATARETAVRGRSGIYDVTVSREADGVVVAEFRGRSRIIGPDREEEDPPCTT